jgi:RimJ/RimL family protein N-acetyltransferase
MTLIVPTLLETPRLKLRMFTESDWNDLSDMFADPDCVRFTIKSPIEKWQVWRTLAGYLGHWRLRGYGPYAVVEKTTNELIGPVGLWYPGDWPEPEIKWSLRKKFWGKGYATEAANRIKALAAQELKWTRAISLILPQNEASKSVAKRIGGTYEKTIPFRNESAEIFAYQL